MDGWGHDLSISKILAATLVWTYFIYKLLKYTFYGNLV